jgi:hypothetical protein
MSTKSATISQVAQGKKINTCKLRKRMKGKCDKLSANQVKGTWELFTFFSAFISGLYYIK